MSKQFQTVQLSMCAVSMSKTFNFKQFRIAELHSLVLFDPLIGPYQILPLLADVNLEAMALKEYSVFPKALPLLEPHHQIA